LTYERAALLDYPDHIVHDKTERLRFANAARPFAEAQRAIQSLWELEMAEWKMLPPAERKVTPMPVLNRACNKTSTKALELSMGVAAKTIVNKHARLGALEAQQVYDFTKQMHRVTGGALALRQQQVKKIYASAPQEKWAAHADVAELHRRRKKHAKERAETAAAFDVVVVEDETLPTPPSRKRSSVIPLEDGEEAQDGFGGGGMEEVLDFEPMPAAPPKKHKQKEVSLTHAKKSAHRGGVTSPEEKARMLAESLSGGAWDQSE
jgi:predicted metal-dependent hydrolase